MTSSNTNSVRADTTQESDSRHFVPPLTSGIPLRASNQQQAAANASSSTTEGALNYGPAGSLSGPGASGSIMNSNAGYSTATTANKHAFTADQDQIILQGQKMGKSWKDIAAEARCESELAAMERHKFLTANGSMPTAPSAAPNLPPSAGPVADITYWDAEDIEALRELLEDGERAKWKYISSELTRERNKRIPAVACQKKFKDMFGVAEASSALASSLCYVVHPNGWDCLEESSGNRTGATAGSSVSSVYSYPQHQQQQQQQQQPLKQQLQPQQQHHLHLNQHQLHGYGPLTTPSGFVMGNVNKKPAINSPQGRPIDGANSGSTGSM